MGCGRRASGRPADRAGTDGRRAVDGRTGRGGLGAGAFGYLAGGYLSPEALSNDLDRFRDGSPAARSVSTCSSRPAPADEAAIRDYAAQLEPDAARFGVGLGDPSWDDDQYPAKIDALLDADVHTVSFTFGCRVGRGHRPAAAKGECRRGHRHVRGGGAGVGRRRRGPAHRPGHRGRRASGELRQCEPRTTPRSCRAAAVRAETDRPVIATGGITTTRPRRQRCRPVRRRSRSALPCSARTRREPPPSTATRCSPGVTSARSSPARTAAAGPAAWPTASRSTIRTPPTATRRCTT